MNNYYIHIIEQVTTESGGGRRTSNGWLYRDEYKTEYSLFISPNFSELPLNCIVRIATLFKSFYKPKTDYVEDCEYNLKRISRKSLFQADLLDKLNLPGCSYSQSIEGMVEFNDFLKANYSDFLGIEMQHKELLTSLSDFPKYSWREEYFFSCLSTLTHNNSISTPEIIDRAINNVSIYDSQKHLSSELRDKKSEIEREIKRLKKEEEEVSLAIDQNHTDKLKIIDRLKKNSLSFLLDILLYEININAIELNAPVEGVKYYEDAISILDLACLLRRHDVIVKILCLGGESMLGGKISHLLVEGILNYSTSLLLDFVHGNTPLTRRSVDMDDKCYNRIIALLNSNLREVTDKHLYIHSLLNLPEEYFKSYELFKSIYDFFEQDHNVKIKILYMIRLWYKRMGLDVFEPTDDSNIWTSYFDLADYTTLTSKDTIDWMGSKPFKSLSYKDVANEMQRRVVEQCQGFDEGLVVQSGFDTPTIKGLTGPHDKCGEKYPPSISN